MKNSRVILIRTNPVMPDPPVEKVAKTLLKYGYEVTIVCWDRNENYKQKESQLIFETGIAKVVRFGIEAEFGGGIKKTFKQFLLFQIRLKRWLIYNHKNYDIIHSFDFDTGYISYKCAKKYNKKFVYHILDYYVASHGLLDSKIGRSVKKKEDELIGKADVTIICTEKRLEQIKDAKPKKIEVIHNTPDIENIKTDALQISDTNKCKIVYVGVLGEGRFIKEMIKYITSNDVFELHIAGFGPLEKYIEEIASKDSRVYFYGRLLYEQTLSLEQQCDIMFAIYDPRVPNHKYSAPNKFYESLMLGKPIIMARKTGFDDIIIKNDIGVVINYDYEGLRQGLEEIYNKKDKWNDMQMRSKEMYNKEYSWASMEKRIMKIYDEL